MSNLQAPSGPAPTFDDVWRMFQETNTRFQETDRQFQETDRQFKATERLMKERAAETDRIVKDLSKSVGALGNRLGDFVEGLVKPGLVRLFQEQGLTVHRSMQNLTCRDDDGQFVAQVDILVVDGDTAIAVECKSKLSVDDVDEHLERMGMFKACWPEYAGYKLLGGVAAMVLPEDVGLYAYRQGLFVLAQSGDSVEIRNDARFAPKVW
jgi:hypothetical protein